MKINNELPTVSTQNPPDPEYLDVPMVPAIIYIPENTVVIEVTATIMHDDRSLSDATMVLNTAAVADARIEGWDWGAENIKYVLKDEAKHGICL